MDKAAQDNKAQQCDPSNPKYEGHEKGYQGEGTKADLDNHSKQLDPNTECEGGKAKTDDAKEKS